MTPTPGRSIDSNDRRPQGRLGPLASLLRHPGAPFLGASNPESPKTAPAPQGGTDLDDQLGTGFSGH